jgi:hypothetical protein
MGVAKLYLYFRSNRRDAFHPMKCSYPKHGLFGKSVMQTRPLWINFLVQVQLQDLVESDSGISTKEAHA